MPVGALVTVPELQSDGLAKMLGEKPGFFVIRFLLSGAEMTQEAYAVLRYCLLPDTRITVGAEATTKHGRILAAPVVKDQKSGLLVYQAVWDDGSRGPLREDAITAVPAPEDPVERLATVHFDDLRPVKTGRGASAPRLEPWGPLTFAAREKLLAWRDRCFSESEGLLALAGARVVPLPHQIAAARTALADRQVRWLLADEVGLGKTIEAGLILQSLLALDPSLRVLVLVPGALMGQWFLELFVRFGGRRFTLLDGDRLRGTKGNAWLEHQLVIASTRAIEELDGKAALQFATARWDAVVVDECHRMQPGGILAKRVAVLSKQCAHVLLLSATPARRDPGGWLHLLHLLQPTAWRLDDQAAFTARLAAHRTVADLLAKTRAATLPQLPALGTEWQKALPGDAVVARLAAALSDEISRQALVEHIREHHHLDRRVIRRTREHLARLGGGGPRLALATRALERLPYTRDAGERACFDALTAYAGHLVRRHAGPPPRLAHWLLVLHQAAAHPAALLRLIALRTHILENPLDAAEYRVRARADEALAQVIRPDLSETEVATHLAVSASCHADLADENDVLERLRVAAEAWNTRAVRTPTARLVMLTQQLRDFAAAYPDEKVLVFTAHALAVEPLRAALAKAFGDDAIATFGAHQEPAGREEAARRFERQRACWLLICDPLGGEGRNFQFASVIVHHDLPWSVSAIEQRIGRVDRLGRDGEVPSWLPVPDEACIDQAWAELVRDATGVFQRPAGGLEFALDRLEGEALLAALAPAGKDGIAGADGIAGVRDALIALVADERAAADHRDDAAFAADGDELASSVQLATRVAALQAPTEAVIHWNKGLGGGGKREEESPQPWRLRARGADQPERGVFNRDHALAHPDLSFFAPGHALIDRLISDAGAAQWSSASAWRRKPGQHCEKWDGVRAACVLAPDLAPIVAAGLPRTALRRLQLALPARRVVVFVRSADALVESDPQILRHLESPFDLGLGDAAVSATGDREAWTRPMVGGKAASIAAWQTGIRNAAAAALTEASRQLASDRAAAHERLRVRLTTSAEAAAGLASALSAQLGDEHPDARLAKTDASEEAKHRDALLAALAGATAVVESVAYVAVG